MRWLSYFWICFSAHFESISLFSCLRSMWLHLKPEICCFFSKELLLNIKVVFAQPRILEKSWKHRLKYCFTSKIKYKVPVLQITQALIIKEPPKFPRQFSDKKGQYFNGWYLWKWKDFVVWLKCVDGVNANPFCWHRSIRNNILNYFLINIFWKRIEWWKTSQPRFCLLFPLFSLVVFWRKLLSKQAEVLSDISSTHFWITDPLFKASLIIFCSVLLHFWGFCFLVKFMLTDRFPYHITSSTTFKVFS